MNLISHQQGADGQSKESASLHLVWNTLWSFLGIALGVLLSFFNVSVLFSQPEGRTIVQPLLVFALALFGLGTIIVIIVSFMRRRNREVISLQHRLVKVYLSALEKSALNPNPESSTVHD